MSSGEHPLIRRYWRRLRRAVRGLPADRRAELLAELDEHLRAELPDAPTDAQVRDTLRRLGRPEDIAAAEGLAPRRGIGAHQLAAVIGLLVGGVVLPVVGWVIGAVLLWTSPAWTVRDKLVGTLLVPGGLGLPLILGGMAMSTTSVTATGCTLPGPAPAPVPSPTHLGAAGSAAGLTPPVAAGPPVSHCTLSATTTPVFGIVLLAVLVIVPVATTVYLLKRAQPRPSQPDGLQPFPPAWSTTKL